MTQEEELLFTELSARLPAHPIISGKSGYACNTGKLVSVSSSGVAIMTNGGSRISYFFNEVKPYLRRMSSMTDEEREYFQKCVDIITDENYGDGWSPSAWREMQDFTKYCYERGLDCGGLIEMGLAYDISELNEGK